MVAAVRVHKFGGPEVLTYEQVDEFLANPEPWRRKWGVKVHDLLSRMHHLAMILRARRLRSGALELSMPEVKVDLDAGRNDLPGKLMLTLFLCFSLFHLRIRAVPRRRRVAESP